MLLDRLAERRGDLWRIRVEQFVEGHAAGLSTLAICFSADFVAGSAKPIFSRARRLDGGDLGGVALS
jgi:hypothetical protein